MINQSIKKLLYLILLLSSSGAFAQVNLDSLWKVWNDPHQSDTNRLKAISNISWDGYLYSKPDSAFYFAQLEYDFAKKRNLKDYESDALSTQATSFWLKGEMKKALNYQMKSLRIREEMKDKRGMAASFNNIGLIYKDQGDNANAIDYYTHSLKIQEELGNKRGAASTLNNIGIIYQDILDNRKAIEYFSRSLEIMEKIDYKKGVAMNLLNMANSYQALHEITKAIDCNNKSLEIWEEIGNKNGIANVYTNIGLIYQEQGELTKALEYQTRSLSIQKEISDKNGQANSFACIGIIYQKQGDVEKAINYSKKAVSLAKELGIALQTRNASQTLYEVYKKTGNYRDALEMHELFVKMRDSVLSENSQKEVMKQEMQYSYEKQKALSEKEHEKQMAVSIEKEQKQKVVSYSIAGGLGLALAFTGFIFNRLRITSRQKMLIELQKQEVQHQKELVEEKNIEILDSINYARRIQQAILPPGKVVKEYLKESFIFYKPKDIVAGDFYWMENIGDLILFAAADCTGHGVPGAMVSVVCNNALNKSVREFGLTIPGEILDKTRELVIETFERSEEDVKDGMDISLCAFNSKTKTMLWAGANNPLWIIRNHELLEYKGDKQPIGKQAEAKKFTTHTIELSSNDSIYIFTDGYPDQFGGENNKKFTYKKMRELFLSIQDKGMQEQNDILKETFELWKGPYDQVDDICVIGVRV